MPNIRDHDEWLITNARRMRHEPSDAERRLWYLVRRRKLGGFYFRRQVPIDGYIADFYCDAAKLVVEVDGEHHYVDDEQKRHDAARTARFAEKGIRVIRFSARAVLKESEAVAKTIYRELTRPVKPADPLPSPPPEYRERE